MDIERDLERAIGQGLAPRGLPASIGPPARCRVNFDHDSLDHLRQSHPAWRLLRSDHAALVASFLHRAFIAPNERVRAQSDLAEALEDELYALRERAGADAFPRAAIDYLNDWASPEKGWLRKFYRQDSDEPPVRPHPGHREGDRLARIAHRTQLRGHRIAPADAVRAAETDERRLGNGPSGAYRRAPQASWRARRRDRARAGRRHCAARRHGAQGSVSAVHAARTRPPHGLPGGGAELPDSRPQSAGTHRSVGGLQG